jgi:hypothetical protein
VRRGDDRDAAFALGLQQVSEALSPLAPPPGLRARLLDNAQPAARFARFENAVAQLLDLDLDHAKQLIARLDDASAWTQELPGISFLWVDGGPRVADAIRGFIRVDAGQEFPQHEHLGEEITLVLQGRFDDRDRGVVLVPGDIDRMPAGTSHGFRVRPGIDGLKLAVVHTGLRALGHTYLPR